MKWFHSKMRYKIAAFCVIVLMALCLFFAWKEEGMGENWYMPAAVAAILGAGLFILLIFPPRSKTGAARGLRITWNVLMVLGTPLLAVWLLQNYTLAPFRIYPLMLLANCVFYYLFYLLLTAVFGSGAIGFCIADVIFMLLGITNYFVVQFRGSPVVPWDLLSMGTAASVAGNYSYFLSWRFVFSTFGFIGLLVLHSKMTLRIRNVLLRVILAAVFLGGLLAAGNALQRADVKEKLGMDTTLFTPNVRYRNNGFLAAFVGNLHLINIEEPKGYSPEKVEEIKEEEAASAKGSGTGFQLKRAPHIIVILNEAFSDLKVLGDFNTNKDYMPNFRKLMEEHAGGHLMVSVKGGNTANSEYEFLAGDTMAFLPAGSVVFQQFIRDNVPAVPAQLAQLGYTTLGMHPYLPTGWDRDTVYPRLGFQEFLSQNDFVNAKKLRSWIDDQSAFEQIIREYEQRSPGEKQFIFEVTMQNHSGYSKEYEGFSEEIFLEDLTYSNIQTAAAEKYLTLVYESDKALGNLISYFEKEKEPVIIVMFGDHEPSDYVTDVIARMVRYDPEKSIEEAQKSYLVPYMVWSNFDLDFKAPELTSLNYFAANILDAAGIPLTFYQSWLLKLQEQIPVICAGAYVDSEGQYHSYDEEDPVNDTLLNTYNMLTYNHLTDIRGRVNGFFNIER